MRIDIERKINIETSKVSIINIGKREKDHGYNCYTSYRKMSVIKAIPLNEKQCYKW